MRQRCAPADTGGINTWESCLESWDTPWRLLRATTSGAPTDEAQSSTHTVGESDNGQVMMTPNLPYRTSSANYLRKKRSIAVVIMAAHRPETDIICLPNFFPRTWNYRFPPIDCPKLTCFCIGLCVEYLNARFRLDSYCSSFFIRFSFVLVLF